MAQRILRAVLNDIDNAEELEEVKELVAEALGIIDDIENLNNNIKASQEEIGKLVY